MMPAIAILAHSNLDRVAQVVRFLSDANVHICIHVDGAVSAENFNSFKVSLTNLPDILWAKRVECDWGHFSLVEATLGMATEILAKWPDAGHVMLISGDSIPTRPISEFIKFLKENADVDFIESVAIGQDNWIEGGLGIERFTLAFPFSWKKQRWLFDLWVDVQRKLRVKRHMPDGLAPHIGSQWWCLSRQTLAAILADPDRATIDRHFKKCWIPDESYFQTLARKHARNIESRTLLFSRFDHQGKPTAFYDDHADFIDSLDTFFLRKIWPGASGLYQRYLNPIHKQTTVSTLSTPGLGHIEMAASRRKVGRSGLYMHGRAPSQWHDESSPTAAPYDVFTGFQSIFPEFDDWQESQSKVRPHGRLFDKSGVNFVNGAQIGIGGISNSAVIRDMAPESFLCNLIWNTRKQGLKFQYDVDDLPKIRKFFLSDPNANLHIVRHAWVLELLDHDIGNVDFIRAKAVSMNSLERSFLTALEQPKTTCNYNVWTLGEVLSNPMAALSTTLDKTRSPIVLPKMVDASKLSSFARELKNIGVDIDTDLLESPIENNQTISGIKAQL